MAERKCFDCGRTLRWVGSVPGWMNSEQWDAVKAGDYFAPCARASHPNGNCYFDDYGDGVTTLKRKAEAPERYDQGRRDVLNAILALNPEIEAKLAKCHEREPDPEGRLPFDVVFWVTEVASQLGIQPKEEFARPEIEGGSK